MYSPAPAAEATLDSPCPKCAAASGVRCRNTKTGKLRRRPHLARQVLDPPAPVTQDGEPSRTALNADAQPSPQLKRGKRSAPSSRSVVDVAAGLRTAEARAGTAARRGSYADARKRRFRREIRLSYHNDSSGRRALPRGCEDAGGSSPRRHQALPWAAMTPRLRAWETRVTKREGN
ncbi:hypothetical protein [Sorangium sp. So ce1078]|uniref:hypothetical protein n=1 Tax=Sorangium sp. So ce1078 TaxID=3133329 RepID=UPI003F61C604